MKAFTIRLPPGETPDRSVGQSAVAVPHDAPSTRQRGRPSPRRSSVKAPSRATKAGPSPSTKQDGRWAAGPLPGSALRKKHGLQGPIDDAFLDAFLFVRPTGKASNSTGRRLGAERNGAGLHRMAAAVPRRAAREGRQRRHARRHRVDESHPVGRLELHIRQFADRDGLPTSCRSAAQGSEIVVDPRASLRCGPSRGRS